MDIPQNRRWMYRRLDANKRWTKEFIEGVNKFLQFVVAKEKFQLQGENLRYPCKKYKCLVFKFVGEVGYDLYEQEFMLNFYWSTNHGKQLPQFSPMMVEGSYYANEFNPYEQLIMDHAGPSIGGHIENMEENPNPEAQKFFDLLTAAQAPLWEGCDNHSELSISLAALSLKSDYNMSEGCFNRMVQLMGETMPEGNKMVTNLYHARKSYFPLISRLKRLYSSITTTSHMRWHSDNERDLALLCHPSDVEAWKHFDRLHPKFSKDLRNVRL
ncbi:hypothetical protein CR513_11257, partial [Mucuna pruriens]